MREQGGMHRCLWLQSLYSTKWVDGGFKRSPTPPHVVTRHDSVSDNKIVLCPAARSSTIMEALENLLPVPPVPCLSNIFTVFRFISQTVQQTPTSQAQLGALAHIIAQLLLTLDRSIRLDELSVSATSTARESLHRLVISISNGLPVLMIHHFQQTA